MSALENRIAIITGSSTGIGAGVAEAFADEGATVIINYPDESELQNAQNVLKKIIKLSPQSQIIQANVSKENEVISMINEVNSNHGTIDILVNNAGIATSALVHEMTSNMWDELISIHLKGTFLCTREVLKIMYKRNYGKIINTASQLAYKGSAGFSHYTAAKGAILSFTRSLSLEIGNKNIRANCVAPGATETRMLADVPMEILNDIKSGIPKGKIAKVSEIVPSYVFLASEAANHFVGQCLSPNGGDVFL
ncbi:MAG: SDR family oxidoreductase [Gammaproteobacteria bacterium]|jgi:3-oxoacyl-[acyl-carrier protein] reductase|nr:SDR family oxidoreductase [Gammaproteobacteria bacterium]